MMNAELAELVVKLRADTSSLQAEMKRASGIVQQSSGNMQSSFAGVAAAARALVPALSVGAMVAFGKSALDAADRLGDLALRTGVSVETLSALQIPLKQGGSSLEEFSGAISRLNVNLFDLANNQGAADAVRRLGLSIASLETMTPEQRFFAIARALGQIKDQSELAATGQALFGRSFAALIPLIRQTNGELEAFAEQQKLLTTEDVDAISEWYDTWDEFITKLEARFAKLALSLINVRENQMQTLRVMQLNRLGKEAGLSDEQIENMIARTSFEKPRGAMTADEISAKMFPRKRAGVGISGAGGAGGGQSAGEITFLNTIDANLEERRIEEERLAKAMEESRRQTEEFARSLKDRLSQGLTSAIFSANNAGDAFRNMALQIAQAIFERSVAQPLSNSIVDFLGGAFGDSLGSILPSFDVGNAFIPRDMVAQLHQGERVLTREENRAYMSGAGGGVTVVQNNSFGSGVSRAEIQAILPSVAKAAHDAVFTTIQRGGSGAKIVGVR